MQEDPKPRQRDDVHRGWVSFWASRNRKPPMVSKHFAQFTREEFERFAEACGVFYRYDTKHDVGKGMKTIKTDWQ